MATIMKAKSVNIWQMEKENYMTVMYYMKGNSITMFHMDMEDSLDQIISL